MERILFKHVFITGGAGYVGSALVPQLLSKGYQVTVYDLYIYGDVLKPHPRLTQIKGDLRNRQNLIKSSQGCDALIHLACISNDPSFDLDPTFGRSINFDAFHHVIAACKENNIKRLIIASSTSQYGIKPANVLVTEETEPEPITDYARFKLECEKLVQKTDMDKIEYVFVRPATLCGYAPRLRLDLSVNILTINALVNKKIKILGGEQMRPALNMKDMVRFYELMLEAPKEKVHQQAFNVADKNMSIREIAELVKKVIGDHSITFEVTPSEDKRSYHVNTDKMRRMLGFEIKWSIADAIQSIIEAYQKGLIVDGLNNPLYYNIKRMKEIELK